MIVNTGRLSDAELIELRKAVTEFKARVLEILMASRGCPFTHSEVVI